MEFVVLGFLVAVVDSFLWMLYGTILSPVLLLAFEPKTAIPAVLLSQGVAGFVSAFLHHKYENADFSFSENSDLRNVFRIVVPWVAATLLWVFFVVKIDPMFVKSYTAALIAAIGVLLFLDRKLEYSKGKMSVIGFVSAFNKAVSGGGFGPLVTGGQMAIGVLPKKAVAVEAFSKAPICIFGFFTYVLLNGGSVWGMPALLALWASFGAAVWPRLVSVPKPSVVHKAVGIVLLLLSVLLAASAFGVLKISA